MQSIPIKIPMTFSTELKQIILKFTWNTKDPVAKTNLRKRKQTGGMTLPDLRVHYKATVIKTARYWFKKHKHRSMKQNREPRNKPMLN